RRLGARLGLSGTTVFLRIDDARATYPVTIDPFIQQGDALTGGGETGTGHFGIAVSLSDDGNTALIGADGDDGDKGAAWIFTRSGSGWNQQGSKLTGSGEVGNALFGTSVALAGDGNTAIVG